MVLHNFPLSVHSILRIAGKIHLSLVYLNSCSDLSPSRSTVITSVIIGTIGMWIMWVTCYMHQMYPLITPVIHHWHKWRVWVPFKQTQLSYHTQTLTLHPYIIYSDQTVCWWMRVTSLPRRAGSGRGRFPRSLGKERENIECVLPFTNPLMNWKNIIGWQQPSWEHSINQRIILLEDGKKVWAAGCFFCRNWIRK